MKEKIDNAYNSNYEIFNSVLHYITYDLDELRDSNYVTYIKKIKSYNFVKKSAAHKEFLQYIKASNLCEITNLPADEIKDCSAIFKGQMKMGLIVILQTIMNNFKGKIQIEMNLN